MYTTYRPALHAHPWKVEIRTTIFQKTMSLRDFTKTYSTTEKASFWCNYMTALKGPLCVQDKPNKHEPVSVWTKVSSSDITLYDVLFGKL